MARRAPTATPGNSLPAVAVCLCSRLFALRFALAAVLLALAGAASANDAGLALPDSMPAVEAVHRPEWIHVLASDPNMEFYLDRASISEHHGEVDFWDVVIFRKPTQHDDTSDRWIKEKRTLRRVRCTKGQQALIKGSSFDEDGHLIEAVQLPPSGAQFVPVHPGSVAASELYRVCKEAGIDVPNLQPSDESTSLGPRMPSLGPAPGPSLIPPSQRPRPLAPSPSLLPSPAPTEDTTPPS